MMYYYSKVSERKIIHDADCIHTKRIALKNVDTFESLYEAYDQGYHLCRHCSGLYKQFEQEKKKLKKKKKVYGIRYEYFDQYLQVYTQFSEWRILASDNNKQLVLFHKNTKSLNKDQYSPIPGYHDQKIVREKLVDFITYILDHEYSRSVEGGKAEKCAPIKGCKRFKEQQKKLKEKEEKRANREVVNRLWNIFDTLQKQHATTVN